MSGQQNVRDPASLPRVDACLSKPIELEDLLGRYLAGGSPTIDEALRNHVLLAFIGAATQVWGLTLFADWFGVAEGDPLVRIGGMPESQEEGDRERSDASEPLGPARCRIHGRRPSSGRWLLIPGDSWFRRAG